MRSCNTAPVNDRSRMQKGIYQLLIHLSKTTWIRIGKKGTFKFPRGYYVYTGSARNGLAARVERHLRKEKKHFWHVDYLLEHASIKRVFLFPNAQAEECRMALWTLDVPEAEIVVPRFGASDCNCPTHLAFFERLKDVPLNLLHEFAISKR
jgi:Uri superfamily endonuclease